MTKKTQNKTKKQFTNTQRMGLLALALVAFTVVPVMAALAVQNFITATVGVQNPPIIKLAGADANVSQFLQVNVGTTISNNDSILPTTGSNNTLLSNELINFSCFTGDRAYYVDTMQFENTTATEAWDVTLTVEDDLQGNAALSQTFTDTANNGGDADIWFFVSSTDSTTPLTSKPNPGNFGTLTDWLDNGPGDGGATAIQLEVVNSAFSTTTGSFTTGTFTIPAGERRQLAMVVDCGANMADEVAAATTGTIRITAEMTN